MCVSMVVHQETEKEKTKTKNISTTIASPAPPHPQQPAFPQNPHTQQQHCDTTIPRGLQNPADMPTGIVNVLPCWGPRTLPAASPLSLSTHTTHPIITGTRSSGTVSLRNATSLSGCVGLMDWVMVVRTDPDVLCDVPVEWVVVYHHDAVDVHHDAVDA